MTMDAQSARVLRLAEGFNALLEEYDSLLTRSINLERAGAEAKAQFERFVAERGNVGVSDLKDFELRRGTQDIEEPDRRQVRNEKWWMRGDLPISKRNLLRTRYAVDAVSALGLETAGDGDAQSKISSEVVLGSSAMPSISESPLELDFTVPGTPSRLDCPFASMSNRRLSAHAASVMSRYRSGPMTPRSSQSRTNGASAAPVVTPPLASDGVGNQGQTSGNTELKTKPGQAVSELEASIQGSAPQCPIRFLNKNSPEEVASYFEKHKHELPRSHEICVKRYQGDEKSVRQLDAKYGNLVSMIQGLGQKHVPMLPPDKMQNEHDDDGEGSGQSAEDAERVRMWASKVSDIDDAAETTKTQDEEERQSHFDRPLKDVRVGESPSRPWGIPVPLSAIEKAEQRTTKQNKVLDAETAASKTAPRGCPFANGAPPGTTNPHKDDPEHPGNKIEALPAHGVMASTTNTKSAGKCPFSAMTGPGITNEHAQEHVVTADIQTAPLPAAMSAPAVFLQQSQNVKDIAVDDAEASRECLAGMTFTGPVFIGYSPEQAAAVIRALQSKD